MTSEYQAALGRESISERMKRIAHHEAGHTTVALVLRPEHILSVELGNGCGQVNLIVELKKVQDLEAFELYDAAQACAGLIGELLHCGYCEDRASAQDILNLYQIIGHVAVEAYRRATGMVRLEVFELAVKEKAPNLIKEGERLAETILLREHRLFHAIANALLAENLLARETLLELKRQYASS